MPSLTPATLPAPEASITDDVNEENCAVAGLLAMAVEEIERSVAKGSSVPPEYGDNKADGNDSEVHDFIESSCREVSIGIWM